MHSIKINRAIEILIMTLLMLISNGLMAQDECRIHEDCGEGYRCERHMEECEENQRRGCPVWECVAVLPPPPICGDEMCTPNLEDCGICPEDCGCEDGYSCQANRCQLDDDGESRDDPRDDGSGDDPDDDPNDDPNNGSGDDCQESGCPDGMACLRDRCEGNEEERGGDRCFEWTCKTVLYCGDMTCSEGIEDCNNCSEDCGFCAGNVCNPACGVDEQCFGNQCQPIGFGVRFASGYTSSVNAPIQFEVEVVTHLDETVTEYHWDFGDGTTSTAPTPSHSYHTEGEYTVRVTVKTNTGLQDSATTMAHIVDLDLPQQGQNHFCLGANTDLKFEYDKDENALMIQALNHFKKLPEDPPIPPEIVQSFCSQYYDPGIKLTLYPPQSLEFYREFRTNILSYKVIGPPIWEPPLFTGDNVAMPHEWEDPVEGAWVLEAVFLAVHRDNPKIIRPLDFLNPITALFRNVQKEAACSEAETEGLSVTEASVADCKVKVKGKNGEEVIDGKTITYLGIVSNADEAFPYGWSGEPNENDNPVDEHVPPSIHFDPALGELPDPNSNSERITETVITAKWIPKNNLQCIEAHYKAKYKVKLRVFTFPGGKTKEDSERLIVKVPWGIEEQYSAFTPKSNKMVPAYTISPGYGFKHEQLDIQWKEGIWTVNPGPQGDYPSLVMRTIFSSKTIYAPKLKNSGSRFWNKIETHEKFHRDSWTDPSKPLGYHYLNKELMRNRLVECLQEGRCNHRGPEDQTDGPAKIIGLLNDESNRWIDEVFEQMRKDGILSDREKEAYRISDQIHPRYLHQCNCIQSNQRNYDCP